MPRVFPLAAVVLAAAAALAAPRAERQPAAEWPQFRGPQRNNLSPDTGLLKEWPKDGPPLAWKATGVGTGFSSVTLAGGRLFTLGNLKGKTYLFALDAGGGKHLWSAEVGRPGGNLGCTPTVDGDRVYAIGQDGDLICAKADTGEVVWRRHFKKDFGGACGGWSYTESPLVDGDQLVCTPGGKDATLIALNKKTGEVIWKCPVPGGDAAGYSSVVITEAAGVRQYVQLLSNGLVGVRAKDGKFLWRYGGDRRHFGGNTANIPTPIIVKGDRVFASAGYGRGGALIELVSDGGEVKPKEIYFNRELNNKHGGVLLVGKHVYGDRDDSGNPFCADLETGKVVWKKRDRSEGRGSAAITYADGNLYVRYDNGWMALVPATPDGYEEKGGFKIPNSDHNSWAHPVVVGGKLYLREKDVIWCYDVKKK
ncbi:MAG TPA: PQQ-binding-like beta-propeller repeat protein [Gemmataceae bacterium]|nr:PQQ-binding-like beta-propeller repeat protein [Gemmataceae bacterium]